MAVFPVDSLSRFATTEREPGSDEHEYPAILEIQSRNIHALNYRTEEKEDIIVVTAEFNSVG